MQFSNSIKITKMKAISIFLIATVFLASCASTTMIQSTPSGADIYVDSQKKGTTPYSYSDTKIVGSSTNITLKKDGYTDFNVTLVRSERADVGAIIGGCFVLVPFLWTMKYDPTHSYELQHGTNQNLGTNSNQNSNSTNELVKLKNLLDQNAITKDDNTILKVKILNNEYDYNNSIADQINKLKGLLDSNLLTKDEYTSQKNKLVNEK
jgi:hypothetical protein